MNLRQLGRTGLAVSEVGFGAWGIGGEAYGPTDDRVSIAALRRAFEFGINFFDTADTYGDGRSERLIAQALGAHRDEILIATKAGNDFYGEKLRKNFDPDYLRFALEKSLERLGTDRVDLYQLHNPSIEIMRDGEAFAAMRSLVREGKARAWGVSVREPDEIDAALAGRPDVLQTTYNLLWQHVVDEREEAIRATGVGLIARSPFEYGLLTGKYAPGHRFGSGDSRAKRWSGEQLDRKLAAVEAFRFLVRPPVETMAEAALRFVLAHPLVSVVIPGAKSPGDVEANARASGRGTPLSVKDIDRARKLHAESRRGER
ncbi:MAG: aldo/keto reductase [Myxococcales bacterium]|nr:aldo/keto reductase [Myxococcales bacterium]